MAAISISITESVEQIVSGIPRSIAIATNTICTIFYTLDGTDPTMFSEIYTSPIINPKNINKLTLKILATDGITTSPIITETYATNIINNIRLPHSGATDDNNANDNLYPFGTHAPNPDSVFLNPGDSGINVNDPNYSQIPDGYGYDGYANSFTNEPFISENYAIRYAVNNSNGEMGNNIGNLPKITAFPPIPPPEESEMFSNLFDPKALVIFQDAANEDPTSPPNINRQFFSLISNKNRDGAEYYNVGLNSPAVSGSFVNSYFNPRDNSVTSYFFDSIANRWIISKAPYEKIGGYEGNLSGSAMSSRPGMQNVFKWRFGAQRYLF